MVNPALAIRHSGKEVAMIKHKVNDPHSALAYMVDCTLATVERHRAKWCRLDA